MFSSLMHGIICDEVYVSCIHTVHVSTTQSLKLVTVLTVGH